MDEAGLRLSARRLPEGLSGIGQLHALIADGHGTKSVNGAPIKTH
jgi:hypothetical protein